jgi:hypothetical protein
MEAPLDSWYAWLGLAATSVVLVGAAGSLPTRPPPDAAGLADSLDRTAVSDAPASAEHPLAADRVRLGADRVALRNDAGTARARLAFGPVTPVRPDTRLASVLHGTPPRRAFADRETFADVVGRARERGRNATWRPAPESVTARRVSWGEVDVTLVGA